MPTDGTLLLEHMPNGKQYLVTALSVFFSFGSVLSAAVALTVIPSRSCSPNVPCDVATQNTGWQYMLVCLGIIVCPLSVDAWLSPTLILIDTFDVSRAHALFPFA
jgi:hypothetical protein